MTNLRKTLENSFILRPARVQSIILDENHRSYDRLGKEESIGIIFFSWVEEQSSVGQAPDNYITARPLNYNISQYPVLQEIVYILWGPTQYFNEQNNFEYYYLSPLSLFKSPSSNAYPDYLTENNDFHEGEYFKESTTTRPLRPYEGDIVFEGRFGQSIRFGSTIDNTKTSHPNPWSNIGKIGNPITIIRSGQKVNSNEPLSDHIIEDINGDASSIYLCTYQQISNFVPASTHDESYLHDVFINKQITEPQIPNNELPELVEEDIPLNEASPIPPEEVQQSDELSDVNQENSEIAHYDIADTEQQGISSADNIEMDNIPVDLEDKINENL